MHCSLIMIGIGYSKEIGGGFSRQKTLPTSTNSRDFLLDEFKKLYYKFVENYPIRRIDMRVGKLSNEEYTQVDLFSSSSKQKKEHELYKALGEIKDRFGNSSVNLATSYTKKATLPKRQKLIGGHNAE